MGGRLARQDGGGRSLENSDNSPFRPLWLAPLTGSHAAHPRDAVMLFTLRLILRSDRGKRGRSRASQSPVMKLEKVSRNFRRHSSKATRFSSNPFSRDSSSASFASRAARSFR